MTITPETLAEMRRLHLNATAAPWVVEEHMDGILTVETSNEAIWKRLDVLQISIRGKERLRGENNGRFIALVRNNIGALLDELEAVRAERDRLRAAANGLLNAMTDEGEHEPAAPGDACEVCVAWRALEVALGGGP